MREIFWETCAKTRKYFRDTRPALPEYDSLEFLLSYLKPVSIYSTIVTDRILNRVLKHQKIRLCTLYVHCSTVGLYGGEERFGLSFEK